MHNVTRKLEIFGQQKEKKLKIKNFKFHYSTEMMEPEIFVYTQALGPRVSSITAMFSFVFLSFGLMGAGWGKELL